MALVNDQLRSAVEALQDLRRELALIQQAVLDGTGVALFRVQGWVLCFGSLTAVS